MSSKPAAAVVCVPVKNRYSDLCEEVDIAELLSFDPNVLPTLSHEDQINYIGEEIYARVAVDEPARAGLITGMLLEISVPELVSMLNDPGMFQSLVGQAIEVLVQAK
jgi:polyadenylate-binding protein